MTRYWCAIKIFRGGLVGGGAPPAYRRSGPSAKNRTGPCKRKDAQGLKRMKKNVSDIQIYQALHQYGCRRLHSKRYSVEREEHYIKYKFMLFCPLGVPSLTRYWCCNQNIRFVFCDFRRRRKSQKTKPGPASATRPDPG